MAPTLYRDTGYSLSHLIEDIKIGRIGLPDIQRPFVWSSAKARDLLVVDGQQRLTSLFAVLTGRMVLTKTFEQKRIRVAFRPEARNVEL